MIPKTKDVTAFDQGQVGVLKEMLDRLYRMALNTTGDTLNGDIAIGSVGSKIGTASTQLLGFYGATPVDRPATVADAATQDLTGAGTVDQTKLEADLTSCKNAINAIIDRLQELGLIS